MATDLFPPKSFLDRVLDPFGRTARLEAEVRRLDKALGEVRETLAAAAAAAAASDRPFPRGAGRTVVDLVGALRDEASDLFGPHQTLRDAEAPSVVVEGLEVEIRGDLDLTDGVGLRAYAADQASPQAASTIRFSLRPEVRIVAPSDEELQSTPNGQRDD